VIVGGLLLAATAAAAPAKITVATSAGERTVPVRQDPSAGPLLPAASLLAALGGTSSSDGVWLSVQLGSEPYRFLLGAAVFTLDGRAYPLAAPARMRNDSLFLPLQFVSEALPRLQANRFSWDPRTARLTDRGPVGLAGLPKGRSSTVPTAAEESGLRRRHRVTLDPGHGGVDPGNPGLFFPAGLKEKDVTLSVGLLLREVLRARGVEVTMTRAHDTLIDLRQRGRYCADACDLFVSLHVNSLRRRTGYTTVRGFETFFLAEARTEDAARVARMENEAIRFDQSTEDPVAGDGLGFILKDLQLNEHLRESARVAELIQGHLDRVHSGENRGVKQAGFVVLTTARRPAVLVELGYSTNRHDARLLTDTATQRRLVAALADAILAYLAEYERRSDESASGAPSGP
jgi:N-acetylmuramoyl-L-alanine amidase